MSQLKKLQISELLLDPRLDLRVARKESVIEDYKARYHELQKGKVFFIEELGKWALIDGWTRLEAARRLKLTHEYFQDCGKGDFKRAFTLAFESNKYHGQPFTRADNVKLVHTIHEEQLKTHPKWNMNDTAKLLGMKPSTVQTYFRRPNGRYSEPVDHGFSTRPTAGNVLRRKKSELDMLLDQAAGLISSGAGRIETAVMKFTTERWSNAQKARLIEIAKRFEKALPEDVFVGG